MVGRLGGGGAGASSYAVDENTKIKDVVAANRI